MKFWHASSEVKLAELVASANAMIAHVNLNVVDEDRVELLDLAEITRRWRDVRR